MEAETLERDIRPVRRERAGCRWVKSTLARAMEPGSDKGTTMTTLENRPNTALLVIDVQNGVVEGAHERDAVVANVGSLVEKARQRTGPRRLGPALRATSSRRAATTGGSSPS